MMLILYGIRSILIRIKGIVPLQLHNHTENRHV